jgi:chromatin remodeling complex protein RSC6
LGCRDRRDRPSAGSENTKMPDKKPNGLQQVLKPSADLAAIVGSASLSRGEVVSKMWAYIKANKLQNPANKREIIADAKLKPVFHGKDRVNMFEMNKHLAQHLK